MTLKINVALQARQNRTQVYLLRKRDIKYSAFKIAYLQPSTCPLPFILKLDSTLQAFMPDGHFVA